TPSGARTSCSPRTGDRSTRPTARTPPRTARSTGPPSSVRESCHCQEIWSGSARGVLYMLLYTARAMASTRTQIYLTAEQRKRLDELATREGKSLAEVIRESVDRYLAEKSPPKIDLQAHLDRFFGSMPDLKV